MVTRIIKTPIKLVHCTMRLVRHHNHPIPTLSKIFISILMEIPREPSDYHSNEQLHTSALKAKSQCGSGQNLPSGYATKPRCRHVAVGACWEGLNRGMAERFANHQPRRVGRVADTINHAEFELWVTEPQVQRKIAFPLTWLKCLRCGHVGCLDFDNNYSFLDRNRIG